MTLTLYKGNPQQHIYVITKVINFKMANSRKINASVNSRKTCY